MKRWRTCGIRHGRILANICNWVGKEILPTYSSRSQGCWFGETQGDRPEAGFGTVWVFFEFGEALYRIKSCAGMRTANVAYGTTDRTILSITEAEQGVILTARMPFAGRLIFGLS